MTATGGPIARDAGRPNAAFMPGLFGPIAADGGPGSIWRIDGRTGAVSLFANVVLAGVPNSGPALGGLAFDPASRQLFAADRDTGMIHRFSLDGADRGQFDHGIVGLSAAGFAPAPFDPRKRLDPESPAFDSTAPATWALAPPAAARVRDRGAGGTARITQWPRACRCGRSRSCPTDRSAPTRASRCKFRRGPRRARKSPTSPSTTTDACCWPSAARRPAPTTSRCWQQPRSNRTLRLRPKPPGAGGKPFFWEADGEYAVGFPPDFQNANGGVAIGYGYESAGTLAPADLRRHRVGDRRAIAHAGRSGHRTTAGGGRPVSGRWTAG